MTGERASGTDEADGALMLRVQAHDSAAFGALYDRFETRAYRLAYAAAGDRPRAEDIVQAAFLSVWRGAVDFPAGQGTVAAWLMGVVRDRANDTLPRHGRRHARPADAARLVDERQPATAGAGDTTVEAAEAARLRTALDRLPAAQRDVITMAYFGELSSAEIAQALSLPPGTVKGRMRLALHRLHTDGGRPPGPADGA